MAKPKSEGPTPAFSLNNIQISGGLVEFDDHPVDERHVVSDLSLSLPFVSSMAYAVQSFVEPAFSAHINGAPIHRVKDVPVGGTDLQVMVRKRRMACQETGCSRRSFVQTT